MRKPGGAEPEPKALRLPKEKFDDASQGPLLLYNGLPQSVILRNEEPLILPASDALAGEEMQRSEVLRFAQNDGEGERPVSANLFPN